jgi:hypothetical protein
MVRFPVCGNRLKINYFIFSRNRAERREKVRLRKWFDFLSRMVYHAQMTLLGKETADASKGHA